MMRPLPCRLAGRIKQLVEVTVRRVSLGWEREDDTCGDVDAKRSRGRLYYSARGSI